MISLAQKMDNYVYSGYIRFEVTQKSLLERKHKWQMTPAVTLQKILVFHREKQLKGIVETVEVLAYKAMSFTMDHFALEMGGWVDVHVSACSRAFLFVCASL